MAGYGNLLYSFFKIGLVGFGGGYAMLPLIRHEVVDVRGWLSDAGFADVVALSQMTPGPVSMNAATFVGMTTVGLGGAFAATAAVCFAPFVLSTACARGYAAMRRNRTVRGAMKALKPVVIGLVAAAALSLVAGGQVPDAPAAALFAAVLALSLATRLHPLWLLAGAGFAGWLIY